MTTTTSEILIRERRSSDLPSLATILTEVHELDGYPVEGVDDPLAWLTSERMIYAWVAQMQGVPGGHVALTRPGPTDGAASLWASQTGARNDGMAVLGRLFVAPAARGRGVGVRLTSTATEYARSVGRRAVLDVMTKDTVATHLYESLGWRSLGPVDHHHGADQVTRATAYVSP